ncbi:MAG: RNA chaperone Hfq [Alphaproteobacteria bacterium]|nr:RNA chaperone Hfq [Alphaproteobacteria bacterium]
MNSQKQNIQDDFLKTLIDQNGAATIFLVNGVKLQGVVTAFDDNCLLLRREAHEQLVYKRAISTIMPHANVTLADPENGRQ